MAGISAAWNWRAPRLSTTCRASGRVWARRRATPYTESETEITGGDISGQDNIQPLPGLSENVWSATVFYDYEAFSAHVNIRYRDEFIQKMPPVGAAARASQDYTTIDAQVSYAFDNGFSVVLSGNNLTDEAAIIEYGVPGCSASTGSSGASTIWASTTSTSGERHA